MSDPCEDNDSPDDGATLGMFFRTLLYPEPKDEEHWPEDGNDYEVE